VKTKPFAQNFTCVLSKQGRRLDVRRAAAEAHRPAGILNGPAIGCSIVCMMLMTNADEDALRAAGPRVAAWIDKLRHAGHVVFIRKCKMRGGAKPNEGFRIDVDGRSMSVWELWARFRSELGDVKPPRKASSKQKRLR